MASYSDSESFASSRSSSGSEESYNPMKTADCIRNVANFAKVKPFHLLDKKNFNPELLEHYLEQSSPKLVALFDKIDKLDKRDLRTEGKLFKHIIYTDIKSSSYGAKIIASAFLAKGFKATYHVQGTGFAVYPEETLLETKGNNFSLLMSKTIFDRPINVKLKKALLEMYNRRPDNVHGDLVRFILLDQGFKEGIDLFDVKYVHLFEPLVVRADEKQAIGRGTRFCGQRGLDFHPRFGWPLYVFRYEVTIPEEDRYKYEHTKQMFELYLRYSNIDLRKIVFAAELEQATIDAAVDKQLTQAIHQFYIERPPPILQEGGVVLRSSVPKPPAKLFHSVSALSQYIQKGFKTFSYPKVVLENQCKNMNGGAAQMVEFTPTQDFVRHYFQPASAYKGMLLWHSVGTGKTCSAIATASTSFEKDGYTILWVTRHTLKSDIWKNMFQWVCSKTVQERLDNGSLKLPKPLGNPSRFAPPEWMDPISYKQFSNMLLQKNSIYSEIVRRNGNQDPLRKTLVIIDEAHKLYSPTVVGSEKPNTDILEKMVQHSYAVSGKDSVRLLVMTATPYTEDSMEMIKLLNLLRPSKDALPTDFDAFSEEYLDDKGFFKPNRIKRFQDDISGYISYLNRSQDARNFAHPVLEDVFVPMTKEPEEEAKIPVLDKEGNPKMTKEGKPALKNKPMVGKNEARMKELIKHTKEANALLKKSKKEYTDCEKGTKKINVPKEELNALKEAEKIALEECKEKPVKERKPCREEVKAEFSKRLETLKATYAASDASCEELLEEYEIHTNTVGFLKEEKAKVRELLDDIKSKMKALKEESEELKKKYDNERRRMDRMKRAVASRRKAIRKIKDVALRKQETKTFRETDLKELKKAMNEFKTLRARISEIKETRTLMRLQLGKAKLKRISQEAVLNKKCKVGLY